MTNADELCTRRAAKILDQMLNPDHPRRWRLNGLSEAELEYGYGCTEDDDDEEVR